MPACPSDEGKRQRRFRPLQRDLGHPPPTLSLRCDPGICRRFGHGADGTPRAGGEGRLASALCSGQPIACTKLSGLGYLFLPAAARKVVLVSHGSQGIDSRMLDYVDYVRSGESKPSSDANVQAMMKDCRGKGFHTGHAGDRFIGVPHWIGFFKKHL